MSDVKWQTTNQLALYACKSARTNCFAAVQGLRNVLGCFGYRTVDIQHAELLQTLQKRDRPIVICEIYNHDKSGHAFVLMPNPRSGTEEWTLCQAMQGEYELRAHRAMTHDDVCELVQNFGVEWSEKHYNKFIGTDRNEPLHPPTSVIFSIVRKV